MLLIFHFSDSVHDQFRGTLKQPFETQQMQSLTYAIQSTLTAQSKSLTIDLVQITKCFVLVSHGILIKRPCVFLGVHYFSGWVCMRDGVGHGSWVTVWLRQLHWILMIWMLKPLLRISCWAMSVVTRPRIEQTEQWSLHGSVFCGKHIAISWISCVTIPDSRHSMPPASNVHLPSVCLTNELQNSEDSVNCSGVISRIFRDGRSMEKIRKTDRIWPVWKPSNCMWRHGLSSSR